MAGMSCLRSVNQNAAIENALEYMSSRIGGQGGAIALSPRYVIRFLLCLDSETIMSYDTLRIVIHDAPIANKSKHDLRSSSVSIFGVMGICKDS